MTALGERRWSVYRCYDADNRLLYVGCTGNIASRLRSHRTGRTPTSAALMKRMTRYSVDLYPHRQAATEAERVAIFTEAPLLNILHQHRSTTAKGFSA